MDQVETVVSPFSRKRKVNELNWKRNKAKTAKNLGKEYVARHSENIVPARKIGDPCGCKRNCFQKIGEEHIERIFNDYWKLGDNELQKGFIISNVDVKKPESHVTNDLDKQKKCRREYSFRVNNEQVRVCMKAFLSVLGEF